MADINAVDLAQETYNTLDGTEQIIMFDTAEGKRATVAAVGDYILKKLATLDSKTVQATLSNLKTKLDGIDEGANAYSLPAAASDVRGGVKIGYEQSGKNYPVQLTAKERMYVNVPWVDTTYSNATESAAGLMSDTDKTKLDGIGTVYYATSSNAITTAGIDTFTNGASITLPANGVYVIIGFWSFNSRSSTGTTNSSVCIKDSSNSIVSSQRILAAGSNWNAMECMYIASVGSSSETFTVCGSTSIAYTSASGNWIRAVRIA